MGTVPLSVESPFGALVVWKTATVHAIATTHGVLSALCLAMPPMSCHGTEHRHALDCSFLAAQVEPLQRCLEHVASFLERVEAALNRLSLLPAMLSPLGEVGVGSMKDMGVELYGCLSPRVGASSSSSSALPSMPSSIEGEAIAVVVAPVLQIMSDL
jgi:hypothetical protein